MHLEINFTVPVLVLIAIFRKSDNAKQGISLWMFEIIAFVLVFADRSAFVATAVLAFMRQPNCFR